MNDDELKKLFDMEDDSNDTSSDAVTDESAHEKAEEAGDVKKVTEAKENSEEASEDVTDGTSDDTSKEEKVTEKPEKLRKETENKPENKAIKPAVKDKKAPSVSLADTIKKVLKKRKKAVVTKLNSDKSESSKRKDDLTVIPLNERTYLDNFPLTFTATLSILLLVSVLLLVFSFIFLPYFRVKQVNIDGNIVISDSEIMEQCNIRYGSHLLSGISGDPLDLLSLDYGNTENRIKAENPYVEDIQISVSFPSTINITVKERNKTAYIKMPDGYAAVDAEGTVLELVTVVPDDSCHALITGLEVKNAVLMEKIEISDETSFDRAIIVLGAVLASDLNGAESDKYMMFENVYEIRVMPGGNIFLSIVLPNGSNLQVKLDNLDNINEDMSWLRFAVMEDAFSDLPDGSLDMTGDENIYREYT